MLPSTKTLLGCNLLVLVVLAAIHLARPEPDTNLSQREDSEPAKIQPAEIQPAESSPPIPVVVDSVVLDSVAVDSAVMATTDETPLAESSVSDSAVLDALVLDGDAPEPQTPLPLKAVTLESVDDGQPVVDQQPVDGHVADVPEGPIVLPVNSAYSDRPLEDESLPSIVEPDVEPDAEETAQAESDAEPSLPGVEAAAMAETGEDVDEQQQVDETFAAEETFEVEGTLEEEEELLEEEGPATTAAETSDSGLEVASEETSTEAAEEEEESTDTAASQPPVAAGPEPPPELTAAQAAVRDRVYRTMATFRRRPPNTRDNTATELMHFCLAFGCSSEIYRLGSSNQKVNGITSLCWNYPCAGFEPLGHGNGRIAARIGYGLQQRDCQLLAVLAFSRLNPEYPIRVGEDTQTVADLVESEKLTCRSGADLSQKLIALMYYVGGDATWQNDLGDDWSVSRIIKEELARAIESIGPEETRRLTALGYAVARREKLQQPIDGEFLRAKKFLDEFRAYALKLQNSNGSWGSQYRPVSRSTRIQVSQLPATGQMLQWMAVSLPVDQLEDPRLLRSVDYTCQLLSSSRYSNYLKTLTIGEIESVTRALHALAVYDARFFKPRTPKEAPAQEAIRQAARTR